MTAVVLPSVPGASHGVRHPARPRAKGRGAGRTGTAAAFVPPESLTSARAAGLVYVSDERPGIHRVRAGKGFRYVDPSGAAVRDAETLTRIRALVIPPAWTDVWICTSRSGHLQATGRDVRGRKQYRYHERWRSVRDENKFGRVVEFARALPAIRRKVAADLRLPGLPRAKVLAAVVHLLETTFIRVGNERYAKENGSYGLTTMRNRHVRVRGERIAFDFRGKSGRAHHVELEDGRLARLIRRCRDLPGYDLFQYLDSDGEPRAIGSADVNEYLQAISGEDYSAKDFRTWAGTVLAVLALRACEAPRSQTHARKVLNNAIATVADHLGNTAAVCRKCYIHPRVLDVYMEGLSGAPSALLADVAPVPSARHRAIEKAVIRLLTGKMRRTSAATRKVGDRSTLDGSATPAPGRVVGRRPSMPVVARTRHRIAAGRGAGRSLARRTPAS
ncbi:MAG: DNA topoisomerase IB [Casimicrobiaceae bacterium]